MVDERSRPEDSAVEPAATIVAFLERGDLDGALASVRGLHPADLADALAGIDADVRDLVLERCEPAELAAALVYLEPHYRDDLLAGLPPERVADVLGRVPDDVATDVVQELPPAIAARVVASIPAEAREALGDLLEHGTETAGGRMTGQRVAVLPHRTVAEVIAFLRSLQPDASHPFYVYVVDGQERLTGVLNLRALVTGGAGATRFGAGGAGGALRSLRHRPGGGGAAAEALQAAGAAGGRREWTAAGHGHRRRPARRTGG